MLPLRIGHSVPIMSSRYIVSEMLATLNGTCAFPTSIPLRTSPQARSDSDLCLVGVSIKMPPKFLGLGLSDFCPKHDI